MLNRIAVLGVGAIGGVIGAYLARAGNDVTLIDMWPANIERIKVQGLTLTAVEEEFTVEPVALHLGEVSRVRKPFDVVVMSVKSQDSAWSARFIEPHLAPGGFIVSAQNGINEETIAEVVGWQRVVGCVVTLGATLLEPGHPRRTTANTGRTSFRLGEPSGVITPRITRMAEVLRAVGPTELTSNLMGERWAKLVTNCMSNSIAGITGLNSAELRDNTVARFLAIRIAAEAVQVSTALGVSVQPITGIPAGMFLEALDDDAIHADVERLMIDHGKVLGPNMPSLAQDVIKGRRTEIDYLNGYVVRKGRGLGIPTPVNEAIVGLTKRVETGDLDPCPDLLWFIIE